MIKAKPGTYKMESKELKHRPFEDLKTALAIKDMRDLEFTNLFMSEFVRKGIFRGETTLEQKEDLESITNTLTSAGWTS